MVGAGHGEIAANSPRTSRNGSHLGVTRISRSASKSQVGADPRPSASVASFMLTAGAKAGPLTLVRGMTGSVCYGSKGPSPVPGTGLVKIRGGVANNLHMTF